MGLDGGVCYNPLHNDLDPYAVAYAIATLLNNLFGKSKEPFWQQAYTDLLKFVILLRRLTDGYTTLAEVYRYVLDNSANRPGHSAPAGHARAGARLDSGADRGVSPALCACPVAALVPGRSGTDGAPIQRGARKLSRVAPGAIPRREAAGPRLAGPSSPTRRGGTLVPSRLESPRCPPTFVHHRRRDCLSVAVRP